jgi:hypothetical protein
MSEQKPNVFPKTTDNQKIITNPLSTEKTIETSSDYDANVRIEAAHAYTTSYGETGFDAIEQMRKRTEEQLRLRDAQLAKNIEATNQYQQQMEDISKVRVEQQVQKPILTTTLKSPVNTLDIPNMSMNSSNSYVNQLSQPQFNMSFDLLPLPSQGKLYKNKKSNVKVAYMTTMDENILTSPNLLNSGEFLEILINRKLLETDLRYRDLHVGDRNAIMLWLRASSYGEMYPVTLLDENEVPFETEVNLNELTVKNLGAEPDQNGLFDFLLPVSKVNVKFKLLTVGDIEDIEDMLLKDKENGVPINNTSVYVLEKQIVDVNGEQNKNMIREFIQTLRIKDAKELRNYIDSIESGVDLEIEVGTPGGGSIKTFLPLNFKFFWPDISI